MKKLSLFITFCLLLISFVGAKNPWDPNLTGWNIRSWANILGVVGTYGTMTTLFTTPTDKTSGNPIWWFFLADNIRSWVQIYGIMGTYNVSIALNYATRDPNHKNTSLKLSNGNLTFSWVPGNDYSIYSTSTGKSSGKWYWETRIDRDPWPQQAVWVGLTWLNLAAGNTVCTFANGYCYLAANGANGSRWHNNVYAGAYPKYTSWDVIWTALDMDSGTISFYKNGSWVGIFYTGLVWTFMPINSTWYTGQQTANFGATAFAYPVPTWYNAGLY